MQFHLPKLKYGYSALEPLIDTETLRHHHDYHHRHYVDKLNAALADHPQLQGKSVEYLLMQMEELPCELQKPVRQFGGGHFNHSLLWEVMSDHPESRPEGQFGLEFDSQLKGWEKFKEDFSKKAIELFGSGHVWLCLNSCQELIVTCTENQDCPLSHGLKPLFLIDVWEHAYYLKYKSRREEYVEAFWRVLDWRAVTQRWEKFTNQTIEYEKYAS